MPEGRAGSSSDIGRISDRSTFEELRRRGSRARRGPISLTYLPDGSRPPRIGFALTREVGSAVVRNRARRRLRSVCRELERSGDLPPGAYLLRGGKTIVEMDFQALVHDVVTAVRAAATKAAAP